jgi:hypothetical protein
MRYSAHGDCDASGSRQSGRGDAALRDFTIRCTVCDYCTVTVTLAECDSGEKELVAVTVIV